MPFDAKELMIDITKAGGVQGYCPLGTYHCSPTFCQCTYQLTFH